MMKKTILTLLIPLCPILAFASGYRYFESTVVNNATDKDSEYIAPDSVDESISNLNSNRAKIKKHVHQKKHNDEKVYEVVEQMPSFPGGQEALMTYINHNIKYPEEDCGQGRVTVSFIVEKDGSITNATIRRSVDPAFDREALRVVSSMPKWIPGKNNGRKVRVRFNVPVQFKLL